MSRIAFYSHDTVGLGHVRRNLLLAEALTKQVPATTALLICGTHLGAAFQLPPNVDCITLPGLAKAGDDGTCPSPTACGGLPGMCLRVLGCLGESLHGSASEPVCCAVSDRRPGGPDERVLGARHEHQQPLGARG